MTAEERNFRSSYYEKVGCYTVEEKKSLNILLNDQVRNHSKLKQFCFTYTVHSTQRGLLWSIILGVMPLHKNSTDYVMQQRIAVYEDLLRAVHMMQYADQTTPKCQVLLFMWLLENDRLTSAPRSDAALKEQNNFLEIVKVLLQVFDNEVETYWNAKGFFACTKDIQQDFMKLRELTQTLLKRDDIALLNHLEKLGVFNILDRWYVLCFAGIISETDLIKVWDKICGGSRKIVVFVFLEMIKTLRDSVLACSSISNFIALIQQIKDQDTVIVNKAIKTWQSNKNHSEITVH